jgi:flagellar biosynthesis protein FliR
MPAELSFPAPFLFSFLMALARVSGAIAFVPLPGLRGMPEQARVALAVCLTLALYSRWPVMNLEGMTLIRLAGLTLAEAAVGITMGVFVAIVLEAFSMAAQVFGVQAGYAYASTVNPETEADSGVLVILAQTTAGLLFFAIGLHRDFLLILARSFESIPAGHWAPSIRSADTLIRFASSLFSAGVRLALPIVALLLMLDLALALLGRLNQQLQLLSLAFPVKMLLSLITLGWIAWVFPRLLVELGGQAFQAIGRATGR